MSRDRPAGFRWPGAAAAAQFALPFALILYLGLRGGGYDQVIWGAAGIGIWWLIVLGAVIGLWPSGRINRGAAIAFGLAGLVALWTTLAVSWTDSAERTVFEAARAVTYLGVLSLGLLIGAKGSARRTLAGAGAAIGLVALLAALSRFEPSLFPEREIPVFLPEATARLSYPLDYWNGLAALIAIGSPLALHMGASSRRPAVAAAWTALLPVMAVALYMTLSRGGALEVGAAVVVYLAVRSERLSTLPVLGIAAVPGIALIWLVEQRDDLAEGLSTAASESQGHEMLALTLAAMAVTGLAAGLAAHLRNTGAITFPTVSPLLARRVAGGIAITLVAGLIVTAVSGEVADRWDDFKNPAIAGDASERLSSSSGNGRYQYWDSSLEANSTAPLTGIGPGTWEFWWAENGTLPGFVRDAHGLYFEVLAEQGIVGLALLLAFLAWIGAVGLGRAFTAASKARADQAAILGAAAAFVVAAGIDWTWEQPVLPSAFMLLTAAMIGPLLGSRETSDAGGRQALRMRLAVGLGAAVVTAALAVPYLAAERIQASQDRAGSGDLEGALDMAREAQSLQPYAATPRLQEALILEEGGLFEEAVAPALEATEREPTNWRTWLVLARAETEAGRPAQATRDFLRARKLNPRSPLFADSG